MKAVKFERYGDPEKVLKIKEIEKPVPKEKEVLVKVLYTAVNDYDWSMVSGRPCLYRLFYGITKPKHQVPGMELAGSVEGLGEQVSSLKIGDAVFGDISEFGFGSFAEYICINEKALIKKPDMLPFDAAVAVPHAFGLAFQALYEKGQLSKDQKVLINGGGGGVGTLGLQLAKEKDCEVTGVDSGEKLEMMRSMGFDYVIDYTRCDFTKSGVKYDLILDCKTGRTAFSYLRSLKPKGKYISIGGRISSLLGVFLWGKIMAPFSSKKLMVLGLKANKGLDLYLQLWSKGKIKTQIDGPYPFRELPGLLNYFGKGRHKGKVVVKTDT